MFTPQAGREERLELPAPSGSTTAATGGECSSGEEDNWPAPGETQRFTFDDICDTPLFMTQEEANRKAASNDTLQAMASFLYEGKNPLEIAALLRDKGNEEMKKAAEKARARAGGKPKAAPPAGGEVRKESSLTARDHHRKAVDLYTEALMQEIDVRGADAGISSALHSNRAQANIMLRNYGKAVDDAVWAIKLDAGRRVNPTIVKAYYRGARAASELGHWEHALLLSKGGLEIDPGNEALEAIAEKSAKGAEELRAKREAENERKAEIKRKREALDNAAKARGVTLTKPIYAVEGLPPGAEPRLDTSGGGAGVFHWPVMFLYPEYSQSDLAADVPETDTLGGHLERMFPRGGGPHVPWDRRGDYACDSLVLYHPGKVSGKWIKTDTSIPISSVLKDPECAIPGMPVFHVVVKGSAAEKALLEQDCAA